jgi:hypothetical protein
MAELREQYLEYLRDYDLAPRPVPSNATELQQRTFERMQGDARRQGDPFADQIDEWWQTARHSQFDLHPAEVILGRLKDWVEGRIGETSGYSDRVIPDTYVGEFPTGDVNARATRVDGGYLVLVNSGLLVLLKQVAETLVRNGGRGEEGREDTIATLASVALAYVRYSDPMFGPLPLSGGTSALVVHQLNRALDRFVIAHEYAHLLCGHLDEIERIATPAGTIDAVRESKEDEKQADLVAHELLLGKDPRLVDVPSVEEMARVEDVRELARAADTSFGMIAPLLFFALTDLIMATYMAVRDLTSNAFVSDTHPSTRERIENIGARLLEVDRKYLYHWGYVQEVVEVTEAVAERAKAMAAKSASVPPPKVGGYPSDLI